MTASPSLAARLPRALLALALVAALAACGRHAPAGGSGAAGEAATPEISSPEYARLGAGFLVWETNRTGAWRIWTRRLDGSGLRQLSADEPGHQHCCAHISPDGKWVAYLSLPDGKLEADNEEGQLHLIAPDGSADRVLAQRAATYSRGHRAAIWHGDTLLQYIDGEGNALRLDVLTGKQEKLAGPSGEAHGYLIDRTLRHATTGLPTFSLYDAGRRAIVERTPFGGCEPYFTDDGRWGVWMAGAGGPMRAIDLQTRATKTLFEKNDPRLGQQAYMYFPMPSNGSALLAFGASPNQHDHAKGNYDVFVVEIDPATLDVLGQPLKYTSAPTSDRYPDVHVDPLALGRTFGEAPFHVALARPGLDADAVWDFGDGSTPGPARGEHTYEQAGSFAVVARARSGELHGRVTVRPAAPPHALGAEARGREIVVTFDEPIAAAPAGVEARLASGGRVLGTQLATDPRHLLVELADELSAGDKLHLAGVVDRAQRPNALVPVDLELAPPRWPVGSASLILVWGTADQPNLVLDPAQGAERTYAFKPFGRARLDHDQAMLLVGDGGFAAGPEAGESLVELAKKSNEITVEATLTPEATGADADGVVLSFAKGRRDPYLLLEQRGDALELRLLRVREFEPRLRFGKLQAGKASHVVVAYSPGHAVAYQDGVKVLDTDAWQGDFFFWKPGLLIAGAAFDGERPWRGRLEGLALYDRQLSPADVAENARRYAALRARRAPVPELRVEATATRCSHVPTLDEIAPYRQGLAVCEYKVDRVLAGSAPGATLRVARWVILDGQALPLTIGKSVTLRLEPFAANPQLESLYLSNDLGGAATPLLYDPFGG